MNSSPSRALLSQSRVVPPQMHALPPVLRLIPLREIPVTMRQGIPYTAGVPPQRVLEAIGPQRVNDGWFADATVRDEYDLLLQDGILYRFYHQGQRWFMRGMYD